MLLLVFVVLMLWKAPCNTLLNFGVFMGRLEEAMFEIKERLVGQLEYMVGRLARAA